MVDRSSPAALRVLTFNIHKGYSALGRRFVLRELREAVRAQGSDLVFLQEVAGATTRSGLQRDGDARGHCEYMADQIWTDHAWARNAAVGGLEHGNAVLSRFPITQWTNHLVAVPGDEMRGLLCCVLQPPDQVHPLHAVCVHLGLRDAHRRRQLARLREVVLSDVPAAARLVVAGDFNDWRSRADQALRGTGLVDVFHHHGGRHARTFPAWLPTLRLDRIYVRGAAATRPLALPRRPWWRLSDHTPLAAEIHW